MRLAIALSCLGFASLLSAQSASSVAANDPFAVTLVQQSLAALTGGATISDVTLNANVISILGSDYETGTATFEAKGWGESRVDLNLTGGTHSDVRNLTNGLPAGAWQQNGGTTTQYPQYNCWTDAAWFFPALSSLAQTTNTKLVFTYIGQEQHAGVNAQHVRVSQTLSQGLPAVTTDFYLDPNSFLPLAVAFNLHADNDMKRNVPNEIRFANYHAVNGVQVPFHFQRTINNSLVLNVNVTSATFNSNLADGIFSLQ
jgi:hypothetical protein